MIGYASLFRKRGKDLLVNKYFDFVQWNITSICFWTILILNVTEEDSIPTIASCRVGAGLGSTRFSLTSFWDANMLLKTPLFENTVWGIWISDSSLFLTRSSIDILSEGARAPITYNVCKPSSMSDRACSVSDWKEGLRQMKVGVYIF